MHYWSYILLANIVYMIGFLRGMWVAKRCQEGRCSVPWCANHKRN